MSEYFCRSISLMNEMYRKAENKYLYRFHQHTHTHKNEHHHPTQQDKQIANMKKKKVRKKKP